MVDGKYVSSAKPYTSTKLKDMPPFHSDIKCCCCIDVLCGVNWIMFFGILDILYLIGKIIWSAYYNTLLKNARSIKDYAVSEKANEIVKHLSTYLETLPEAKLQSN